MRLDIVTLFPALCAAPFEESVLKRARERGIIELHLTDLRQFTHDRHRTVDDRPYGGGPGMLLKPEPLFEAVESLRTPETKVVLLTPQGTSFCQRTAERLAQLPHLMLVSGHYEGVDERARQSLFDEEISIGDYVLTNGALPAAVVADAVVRLLPGVLGCAESALHRSFGPDILLDYPQYTRPPVYRDMSVPDVLVSGDHGRIKQWRHKQQLVRTAARRPDLLCRGLESKDEQA